MCVTVCVQHFTFMGRGSSSWVKGCSNTTAASTFPDAGSFLTKSSKCSSDSKPRTGKETNTHTQIERSLHSLWRGIHLTYACFHACLIVRPWCSLLSLTGRKLVETLLAYWIVRQISSINIRACWIRLHTCFLETDAKKHKEQRASWNTKEAITPTIPWKQLEKPTQSKWNEKQTTGWWKTKEIWFSFYFFLWLDFSITLLLP